MRCSFIPLLVASVVILTSLSDCKSPFDRTIDLFMCAEINGVEYRGESKLVTASTYPEFNGKILDLGSSVYSNDDEAWIRFYMERDTILLNTKYDDVKIYFARKFVPEDIEGWVQLTEIYMGENKYREMKPRIKGSFEFVVKNGDTGAIECVVKKGAFDSPYLSR